MHRSAYDIMAKLIREHVAAGARVLEIGSRQTKATDLLMSSLLSGCDYVGADIRDGKNVDVIVPEIGDWPPLEAFDVVISINTLEHCRRPWTVVGSAANVLLPGGAMILVAPFMWHVHDHPGDYFRFTGAGLGELMVAAGLNVETSGQKGTGQSKADAWAVGRKP